MHIGKSSEGSLLLHFRLISLKCQEKVMSQSGRKSCYRQADRAEFIGLPGRAEDPIRNTHAKERCGEQSKSYRLL